MLRARRILLSHKRAHAAVDRLHLPAPEMHRIHHQHDRHRNNYGDIVCWDMLFGTYENPKLFTGTCGFDAEKEEMLGRMLVYADVHRD